MSNPRVVTGASVFLALTCIHAVADATATNPEAVREVWSRIGVLCLVGLGWCALLGVCFGLAWLVGQRLRKQAFVAAAGRSDSDLAAIRRGGARYRQLLWLLAVSLYASLAVMAMAAIVAPIVVILGVMDGGLPRSNIIAWTGLVSGLILWTVVGCLWASRQTAGTQPELLGLGGQPAVRQLLEEVAAEIGSARIERVWLDFGTRMAVTEDEGLWGAVAGQPTRTLVLGVGLLPHLTVGQLRSIVAHECAHIAHEDTSPDSVARRVNRSLDAMTETLARQGHNHKINPTYWFLVVFARVYQRVAAGASQVAEILADRAAVSVVGSELCASALEVSAAADPRFSAHFNSTLTEVIQLRVGLGNLYAYRPMSTEPVGVQEWDERVDEHLSSHPRVEERARWMRGLAVEAPVREGDQEPAWSIFEGRERIERRVTRRLRDDVAAWYAVRIADAPSDAVPRGYNAPHGHGAAGEPVTAAPVGESPRATSAAQVFQPEAQASASGVRVDDLPADRVSTAGAPTVGGEAAGGTRLVGAGPSPITVSVAPVPPLGEFEPVLASALSWLRTDSDEVRDDFGRLPAALRPILAVQLCLQAVKENNGLRGFFSLPVGSLGAEAAGGFRSLGLPAAASALEEALAFFPEDEARDTAARIARLDAVKGRTTMERDPFREATGRLIKASKPYGAGIGPDCQAWWASASESDRAFPLPKTSLSAPSSDRTAGCVARRALLERTLAAHGWMLGGRAYRAEAGKTWTPADVARFEQHEQDLRDGLWKPLHRAGLFLHLSPVERGIARSAGSALDPYQKLAGQWAGERYSVLAWALGLIDVLPPCQEALPVAALEEFPDDVEAFVEQAELRDPQQIAAVRGHYMALRLRDVYHEQVARGEPSIPAQLREDGVETEAQYLATLAKLAGQDGPDILTGDRFYSELRGPAWANTRGNIRERARAFEWLAGKGLDEAMYAKVVVVGGVEPAASVLRAPMGGFELSKARMRELRPDLFGARAALRRDANLFGGEPAELTAVRDLVAHGLCRAALVVSDVPFHIAAYNEELDCVVVLRFPTELRPPHLVRGARTLCVNGYFEEPPVAPDLRVGEGSNGGCSNVSPIAVELVCDDRRRIREMMAQIPEEEWVRAEFLAAEARRTRPGWARDGAPGRSHRPV